MIKTIPVSQLRPGMHIHEFCGAWLDHPFWRSNFRLGTTAEVQRILASAIREVRIDTSQGADVDPTVEGGAALDAGAGEKSHIPSMPMELDVGDTSEEALARAADICRRSASSIASVFAEARLGKLVDPALCDQAVGEIIESVLHAPGALISVVRLKRRDQYTYMHSVAVCAMMAALGRQLGLPPSELREAAHAGMLHDIGKAVVPLEVLNKPGSLTTDELDVMRAHPQRGHALLVAAGGVSAATLDVCLHHHERMDGSGYPHRLASDRLSLVSKMAAVCDVYDAVTSARSYKAAWDPGEALRRMATWKGHFDPAVFRAFAQTVGIYPVGSLVRLQSGKLAVVVSQNASSLLTPNVKAFFSTKSNLHIEPRLIDLSSARCRETITGCESPENWPFKNLDHLWGAPPSGRAAVPPAIPTQGR